LQRNLKNRSKSIAAEQKMKGKLLLSEGHASDQNIDMNSPDNIAGDAKEKEEYG